MLGCLASLLSLLGVPQVGCVPFPHTSSYPHHRAPSPVLETAFSLNFSLNLDCIFVKHPLIKFSLSYPA